MQLTSHQSPSLVLGTLHPGVASLEVLSHVLTAVLAADLGQEAREEPHVILLYHVLVNIPIPLCSGGMSPLVPVFPTEEVANGLHLILGEVWVKDSKESPFEGRDLLAAVEADLDEAFRLIDTVLVINDLLMLIQGLECFQGELAEWGLAHAGRAEVHEHELVSRVKLNLERT